jgi:lipoteichoic acid synthase
LRALSRLRTAWPALAALPALLMIALRATHLDTIAGAYTACAGCFLLPTLGHDAWLLSLLFVLLGLAAFSARRAGRMIFGSLAAFLLLACALDLVLLRLFNQRFYVADLLRFGGAGAADWSVARSLLFSTEGIVYALIVAAVVVAAIGLLAGVGRRSLPVARLLFVAAVIAAACAVLVLRTPLRYVHDQYAWNVIEANLPQGRSRIFSPAFVAQEQQRSKTLPQTCEAGVRTGRNLVIVITESLSAYQSALLGGPRNWLPRLDALARANHYFSHFYANGFTTDGGEIAILTGRPPLIPPEADWYALPAFGPGDNTVPGIARRAGYTSHYFTTADLSFLDSGTWLHGLGFDTVEGSETPFYAKLPRGQFGAAEDAALFSRFEQWLDQRSDDAHPFVSVLLTVSSHPPFVDPRTGKIDPPGSFAYVDGQLADLHAQLDRRGFFANGILLITGDHRSMTPVPADEFAKFGERSFARIPLIVAGAVDMPAVVDAAFQQSDFPASLAQLMGVEYCHGPFAGYFSAPNPVAAKYVVHARGDDRNRVDVYFGDRVGSYTEDGDASRWTSGDRPDDAAAVGAWIDSERVRNAATEP